MPTGKTAKLILIIRLSIRRCRCCQTPKLACANFCCAVRQPRHSKSSSSISAAAVLAGINGLAVRHTDPKAAAAHCRQLLSAVLDLGQACGGLVSERLTPVAQSLSSCAWFVFSCLLMSPCGCPRPLAWLIQMKYHLSYPAADGALDEKRDGVAAAFSCPSCAWHYEFKHQGAATACPERVCAVWRGYGR